MPIAVRRAAPLRHKTPCLVIGVDEGKSMTPLLKELDLILHGALARAVRSGEFRGKGGETLLLSGVKPLAAERLLLVGLGKGQHGRDERLRQGAGRAAALLQGRRLTSFALVLASFSSDSPSFRAAALLRYVILLGSYRFDRYRTEHADTRPQPLQTVTLLTATAAEVAAATAAVTAAEAVCRGVILARDLVNEPGNVKSPEYLAAQARSVAAAGGMRCSVLEREELEKEGWGALLGVAQGSAREPRLIVLEYQGGKDGERPIALVGKGVVFDAGGISLKPAEKMDEMKMDMAGAAAVLGTLQAAAALRLPVNLVGIIPAVENLPSGTAYRPGDILTSLSGRTVEILNTDAEGRLILADALTCAKRYNPRAVIDLATLTGACIIALGHHASAVLGNNEALIQALLKAGETSGERLWQLPLWEEYGAQIKSEVADVKNTGGRPAGTITAAAFLQTFAADLTWAHLDIAGTAWEEKGRGDVPKGGTGVGVRLLLCYLQQQIERDQRKKA